jgi:hypothetical protein
MLDMPAKLNLGDHENAGRAAVQWGPLVLAADTEHNPGLPSLMRVAFAADKPSELKLTRVPSASIAGEPVWETTGMVARANEGTNVTLRLTPFYAAGQNGGKFAVWIPRASGAPVVGASVFSQAEERRSRQGNQPGSIVDDDLASYAVTFDNTRREEDWYEVSVGTPLEIDRVTFTHGHCFHDGGWFDASVGKPRVQVRKEAGGPWVDVGPMADYPATTASDSKGLKDGQSFTVTFSPMMVYAVRDVGKPASGDNSRQAFSSCAELQAFRGLAAGK